MEVKKIITNIEDETFEFAKNFVKNLQGGEIICLTGDLGAGKTTFTKGLALALNIKKTVTSPTFVIMKIYQTENNDKIKQLCHIDAYRLAGNDLEILGVRELFNERQTVCVIEWPENVAEYLKNFENIINFKFKYIDKDKREIGII